MSTVDGDRAGGIELRGIEPVPDAERHGSARDLVWVWFAANVGVLGIVLGAALVVDHSLSIWEIAFVALIGGGGSFFLVGILSVAGKWGGAPMLTLSRAPFGVHGNRGPTLVSWASLVGWETVMAVTAAYALLDLLHRAVGASTASDAWTIVALAAVVAFALVIGVLGHGTIVWLQKWTTYVFGAMTVVVIALIVRKVSWHQVFHMPAAPAAQVIASIGFIAAGTGIGWINAGADYARYLPRRQTGRAITGWVTIGSAIPLLALITLGGLMTSSDRALASAVDPVSAIGAVLPSWMAVPYLLTAVFGLVAAIVLTLYSSGLNLLALGLPTKRTVAVGIDGLLMIAGGVYIMVIAKNFYGPFTTFLTLLAVPLSAWSGVFGIDMLLRRGYDVPSLTRISRDSAYWYTGGVSIPAVGAWLAATVIGLCFTTAEVRATNKWFTGPFAGSWLGQNGLGWLIALVLGAGLYAVGDRVNTRSAPVHHGTVPDVPSPEKAHPAGVAAG